MVFGMLGISVVLNQCVVVGNPTNQLEAAHKPLIFVIDSILLFKHSNQDSCISDISITYTDCTVVCACKYKYSVYIIVVYTLVPKICIMEKLQCKLHN